MKMTTIEDRVESMEHVVRGNGSPGLVTRIALVEERVRPIEELYKTVAEHTAAIAVVYSKMATYAAIGSFLGGVLATLVLKVIFK